MLAAANSDSISRTSALALISLGVLACAVGCDDREITEHRVAKGTESAEAEPANVVPESDAAGWVIPAGWRIDPEPRPMRLATIVAPDPSGDVEIAVTRFAGRVGGELANVNRWRGQMGLGPIDASWLDSELQRFDSDGFEGYWLRIENDGNVMLAAGVYEAAHDRTWFVRTTASPDAADRLEENVLRLARSIAGIGGSD